MSVVRVSRRLLSHLWSHRLSLAMLAIAGPALAQTGAITGTVTDRETGAAVAEARVAVVTGSGATIGEARTNAAGTYRVANLPSGSYSVVVTRIGYAAASQAGVRVSDGQSVTANIVFTSRATILNPMVVTGPRLPEGRKALDDPTPVSVISEDAIARNPSLTTTDHLRSTPGIAESRGGIIQSNVAARGFNNIFTGALLSLQDFRFAGVPSLRVNVPFLNTGTSEDIEKIEVLLGPASALYGPNSANGVLHVITKSPLTSQGTTVTLDGGSQSILRASLRHSMLLSDNLGVKISAEMLRGKDFEYRDPGEPTTFPAQAPPGRAGQPNNRDFDVEKSSVEGRLDWRSGGGLEAVTTVGLTNAGSALELTGANGAAQVKGWTYTSLQQRVRKGRFFAQAFANFSNTGNEDSLDLGGTFLLRSGQTIVDRSRVFAGQLQHGARLGRIDLTYGVDYIFTNPRTDNTINGRNEDIDDVTEYGVYAQGSRPLTTKLEFLGALRADKHSEIDGQQISPRAAFIYKATPNHNFRATYNRAFSTPANFSYFLDLVSTRNIGGSGFDLRAFGNNGGHEFNRSCTGAAFGDFCMNSIYAPGQPVPASTSAAWTGFMTANGTTATGLITQGLTTAGVPNAAALAAAIVNGLRSAQPSNTDLLTRVAYLSDRTTALTPEQIRDIGRLTAGYNNSFEVGYRGIGDRGRLAIDGWFQQRGDVNPPAGLVTPSVFFDPTSLSTFATANIRTTVTGALIQAGLPPAQAQAQAAAIAAGVVSQLMATPLPGAPLGTITFTGQTRPDLLATYQSTTGEKLDIYGLDVAYDWYLNDTWSLAGTYSWMSENVFDQFQGGNGLPFMSNSSKHRGSLTLGYDNAFRGFRIEARGRYAQGFPVNSGVFYSGRDIPAADGSTYQYPEVSDIGQLDLGASWRVPFFSGQDVMWSINGTNILDQQEPTFAGVPAIGAMVLTRLQWKF